MLTLTAHNLIDELRGRELIVTYDYPFFASLRKPLVIAATVLTLFVAAYVLGSLDVGISGKKFAKTADVVAGATESS
jgi:dolichyl-diphosphooligosaccharide---protein glycosyltransferase subunit 1 (ribophorin I)